MRNLSVAILAMFSLSAFASDMKVYKCAIKNSVQVITIETNTDQYGEFDPDRFIISSPGLFAEFAGDTSDLSLCDYEGVWGGENLKKGMHCEGMSIAGGNDFKTIFTIQSDVKDLSGNPKSFTAVIKSANGKRYDLQCK